MEGWLPSETPKASREAKREVKQMTNYESMKKWARICYLIEKAMYSEKGENYGKYHLLMNLERFAFDMYLAAVERLFS